MHAEWKRKSSRGESGRKKKGGREREGVKEMDVAQEGGKDSGERGMETATLHPSEATSNCTSNRPS